ncbi:hypothetical protein [Haladaptatus halobius]|uniref:hypothetical protein n=1 Tax=Haladaptatus halobius TaxID=2884875 RepID=UPI001D09A365|nr:hypothetical protein [Haladaptatus halobius]
MEIALRLQDGAHLELTDIGVSTTDEKISFSIDGRITDVEDEILHQFSGKHVTPVEIVFAVEEPDE